MLCFGSKIITGSEGNRLNHASLWERERERGQQTGAELFGHDAYKCISSVVLPSHPAVPYILDALFMFGNQLLLCMMDELLADLPSFWSGVRGGPDLRDSSSALKINVELQQVETQSGCEITNICAVNIYFVCL